MFWPSASIERYFHVYIYIYIYVGSQTYVSRKIISQYVHYSSFPLFFIHRYRLIVGHFSSDIIAEYYRFTVVIRRKSILFRNISNNISRIWRIKLIVRSLGLFSQSTCVRARLYLIRAAAATESIDAVPFESTRRSTRSMLNSLCLK